MNEKSLVGRASRWAWLGSALLVAVAALGQQFPPPAGMRAESIYDPALKTKAFDVMVPQKWHFAGTIVQGTSCTPIAFPVFREMSPDGLTILDRFPRLDWKWTDGHGPEGRGDCLPLAQEITARQLLLNVAAAMHMQFVRDDPFPPDVLEKNHAGPGNHTGGRVGGLNLPVGHTDLNRIIVKYRNGSFTIMAQIGANVFCSAATMAGPPGQPAHVSHTCAATVRMVRAPEGQFDAMVNMLENAGAVQNPQWIRAWTNRVNEQMEALRAANQEQFERQQAARQRMHEEFMATMQRGTDMSMQRAREAEDARSASAQNWVDYALDQQTIRDPNSGQTNMMSGSRTYRWMNNSGGSYQTLDPDANPNGTLSGSWRRQ